MHEQGPAIAKIIAHLTNGFKERQAFDIANRAADFDQNEILGRIGLNEFLDRIGNVRNDLHRPAKVIPTAFARNHIGIDPPGGHVIRTAR